MLGARLAHADELRDAVERAPGTVGDPVATLAQLQLAVVTPAGLSIEGALPYEVRTLVDRYDTPLFHLDHHSALTWWGSSLSLTYAPGVEWSGAGVQLQAATTEPRDWVASPLTLTTLDAQIALNGPALRAVGRAWWPWEDPPVAGAHQVHTWPALDGEVSYWLRSSQNLGVRYAAFAMADSAHYDDAGGPADHHVSISRTVIRHTLEELYRRGAWTGVFSQSLLSDDAALARGELQRHDDARVSVATRNELRRALHDVAGLAQLDVRLGAEANVTRHALDIADAADPHENVPTTGIVPLDDTRHRFAGTIWTSDVGAWTSATARLAANIRATTGLRVEAFGTDLSVQPRGKLELDLADRLGAALAAGAYRRAPEHADELEHPQLHPERTTRVAIDLERRVDPRGRGTFGVIGAYYLDRTHLVEDDGTGKLANSGRGTTYGATASAGVIARHWIAMATVVVEHSDRQVTPTSRARPFEYDQPVRFDVRVTHFVGAWQLGAHWALREGLPYTRVAGAHYDADRDVYLPDFAPLYAERFPWQHQLDLRVDRAIGSRLRAYLDIANVYDARAAIGWDYNFNFTVRRAVTAPAITPTLGIRGEL